MQKKTLKNIFKNCGRQRFPEEDMKNNDYERKKMIKWTLSILKHFNGSSMQPLKTEKMETEQNSVDDSGFVHMLL